MATTSTMVHLDRAFSGDVIRPGDEAYETFRRTALRVGGPACILRPRSVSDVQLAVRCARESGLALAVRGGGHSFAGFGTNDGGIVIDLRRLNAVEPMDGPGHCVRIGGGATWGEVADVLQPRGLAISSGDTRSVGVAGLTLTGGIGWKARRRGLALDRLAAVEVVTAGGTRLRASVAEHPDLFWAVRGGGGNFGVVTEFEFVADRTTDVHFGRITYPAKEASRVLAGWAHYMSRAPGELTSIANLANPATGGPGAPVEVWVCCDSDDRDAVARALEPLRCLGTVLDDDVAQRRYSDILEDGGVLPPGFEVSTRSGFVNGDSVQGALDVVTESAAASGSPFISIRSVGGAISRIPASATAYAHRTAELLVVSISAGPDTAVAAARPAVDELWRRLAPQVEGAYANFTSSRGAADVSAIYPPETMRRLREAKRRYDADNLFAGNHNIEPA